MVPTLPGADAVTLPEFLTRDPDGFIHLTGHRVGLQHLVYYYNEGYSAEMLLADYPTLSLALIHKVIAFYLENRGEVDHYVAQCEAEFNAQRSAAAKGPSTDELRERLAAIEGAPRE